MREIDNADDAIPIGHAHPATSLEMADRSRLGFASERARIVQFIADQFERGATAAECGDALGIVRNQAAISLQWLRDHGWIERIEAPRGEPSIAEGGDAMFDKRLNRWWLTRQTSPTTRGIVHRLRSEAEVEFGRWRMDRARALSADGHDVPMLDPFREGDE